MIIVLTGKTASGKDTVMSKLLMKFPKLKRIITTTSRTPRPGEKNGIDYNFIPEADFKQKIERGGFIEWVRYAGNLYGTEKSQVLDNLSSDIIWRIDPSGAGQIRQLIRDSKVLVIYLTVSDEVVLKRLKERGLKHEEISKRMQEDKQFWQEYKDNYDFIVENAPGKLDETLDKMTKIIENHSPEFLSS